MHEDLTDVHVLVRQVWLILHGRTHGSHLGPPCHSWNTLYQNLGPGTRTHATSF